MFGRKLHLSDSRLFLDVSSKVNSLRILASYKAKTTKISNFCTSWSIIQPLSHLHSVSKETQLFFMDFSWGPGSGSCITPDSLVYTLLQKKGNFRNVAFLLRKSVVSHLVKKDIIPSQKYLQMLSFLQRAFRAAQNGFYQPKSIAQILQMDLCCTYYGLYLIIHCVKFVSSCNQHHLVEMVVYQ